MVRNRQNQHNDEEDKKELTIDEKANMWKQIVKQMQEVSISP